jgi:hypothetical protein
MTPPSPLKLPLQLIFQKTGVRFDALTLFFLDGPIMLWLRASKICGWRWLSMGDQLKRSPRRERNDRGDDEDRSKYISRLDSGRELAEEQGQNTYKIVDSLRRDLRSTIS